MNFSQFLVCQLLFEFLIAEQIHMVIDTPSGYVEGNQETNKITGEIVYEFRGIPYGKPPVGPLRFSKPEPAEKWNHLRNATVFKASCPHFIPESLSSFAPSEMSEDCLYLNVYVPKIMDLKRNLPVMVWIHGGSFIFGYSHQFDGGWIATEGDVIVVTINYRLSIFGFLSVDHPAAKGNYGLWDQKLALEWVHNNIAAFGGNPESVTIFGESAGGWSVSFQSLIPSNKGLFHRVLAQSGVVGRTSLLSKKTIKEQIQVLAKRTSCPADNKFEFVDCLRKKSMEEIINAADYVIDVPNDNIQFVINYHPVVDGDLFRTHPIGSLSDEHSEEARFFRSLDFLTGTTSNEGSMLFLSMSPEFQKHYQFNVTEGIPSEVLCQGVLSNYVETYFHGDDVIKRQLCEFYSKDTSLAEESMSATDFYADVMCLYSTIKMLEHHAPSDAKTFQYSFSKATEEHLFGQPPPWQEGVGHGEDLVYMFEAEKMFPLGIDRDLPEDEREVSRRIIQYWTSFARTGIPDDGSESLKWKQFDLKDRGYLDIDVIDTMKYNFKKDMNEFWTNKLPPIKLDLEDSDKLDPIESKGRDNLDIVHTKYHYNSDIDTPDNLAVTQHDKLDITDKKDHEKLDTVDTKDHDDSVIDTSDNEDVTEQNKLDTVDKKNNEKLDTLDMKDHEKLDSVDTKDQKKLDTVDTKAQEKLDTVDTKDQEKLDTVDTKDQEKLDTVDTKDQEKLDTVDTKDQEKLDTVDTKDQEKLDMVDKVDHDNSDIDKSGTAVVTEQDKLHTVDGKDDAVLETVIPQDNDKSNIVNENTVDVKDHDKQNSMDVMSDDKSDSIDINGHDKSDPVTVKDDNQVDAVIEKGHDTSDPLTIKDHNQVDAVIEKGHDTVSSDKTNEQYKIHSMDEKVNDISDSDDEKDHEKLESLDYKADTVDEKDYQTFDSEDEKNHDKLGSVDLKENEKSATVDDDQNSPDMKNHDKSDSADQKDPEKLEYLDYESDTVDKKDYDQSNLEDVKNHDQSDLEDVKNHDQSDSVDSKQHSPGMKDQDYSNIFDIEDHDKLVFNDVNRHDKSESVGEKDNSNSGSVELKGRDESDTVNVNDKEKRDIVGVKKQYEDPGIVGAENRDKLDSVAETAQKSDSMNVKDDAYPEDVKVEGYVKSDSVHMTSQDKPNSIEMNGQNKKDSVNGRDEL